MIANRQLIIREVRGIENFTAVKGGKIVNKEYPNTSEWVFLDGLKIVGTYDGKVLPNQSNDFVIPKKVSNTLYTVAISDPAYTDYDRALLDKNNNVITYLKVSDKVIDGYIYTNNGIYSSNLEEEVNYDFIVSDMYSRSIQGCVGRYAVITYSYEDNYYIKYIASEYEYNTLQNSQIVELNENYLLIQTEDGDYVLYNAAMNKLLSSEYAMSIKVVGDNLIVETIKYGKNAIYFFSGNGGAL